MFKIESRVSRMPEMRTKGIFEIGIRGGYKECLK
jgi:hypothetical protein